MKKSKTNGARHSLGTKTPKKITLNLTEQNIPEGEKMAKARGIDLSQLVQGLLVAELTSKGVA